MSGRINNFQDLKMCYDKKNRVAGKNQSPIWKSVEILNDKIIDENNVYNKSYIYSWNYK